MLLLFNFLICFGRNTLLSYWGMAGAKMKRGMSWMFSWEMIAILSYLGSLYVLRSYIVNLYNWTVCPTLPLTWCFTFSCVRLWDHLAKNLDLYIKPEEPDVNNLHEVKPLSEELPDTADSPNLDPESEKGKSSNLSRSRRNREWKGLMGDAGEPPPLRSSEIRHIHEEAKSHPRDHRARRSISPQHATQRKRSRLDERQQMKVCDFWASVLQVTQQSCAA